MPSLLAASSQDDARGTINIKRMPGTEEVLLSEVKIFGGGSTLLRPISPQALQKPLHRAGHGGTLKG